ncbi:hypothetical protein HD554DRAFT_2168771 [Boletus coccyginus]|nr:hypothetical protein HD554DRAFT_2168771 [Boletus coccyginus]
MPIMTFKSSSIHPYLMQPHLVYLAEFPLRNKSFPLTSPGLTYSLTLSPGSIEVLTKTFHGLTSVSSLDLVNSLPINTNIKFLTLPIINKDRSIQGSDNGIVDENFDSNDMVFVMDEPLEPGKILDFDQQFNLL